MTVKLTRTEIAISVIAPYNTSFVTAAKRLAGKWNNADKAWVFDRRNESAVRNLLTEVYGTDGEAVADHVR